MWSPDDTMILRTCHGGYFRLFNAEDRVTIKASTGPHSGHLWCTAFSEDQENFVTVGHEGQVVLWDLEKLKDSVSDSGDVPARSSRPSLRKKSAHRNYQAWTQVIGGRYSVVERHLLGGAVTVLCAARAGTTILLQQRNMSL